MASRSPTAWTGHPSTGDTCTSTADREPSPRSTADQIPPAVGQLHGREPFFDSAAIAGGPDGLAIDSTGHVWVALWGGGRVICLSPAGELVAEVKVPAPHTSSIAFGGSDLRDLYITTARENLVRPTVGASSRCQVQSFAGAATSPAGWPTSGAADVTDLSRPSEQRLDRLDHRVIFVDQHHQRPSVERRARMRNAQPDQVTDLELTARPRWPRRCADR